MSFEIFTYLKKDEEKHIELFYAKVFTLFPIQGLQHEIDKFVEEVDHRLLLLSLFLLSSKT